MLTLLIKVVVLVIVAALLWWGIDTAPMPPFSPTIKWALKIIVILIVCIVLLALAGIVAL